MGKHAMRLFPPVWTQNNISYHKRKRAPKNSTRQLKIIPKCCRALRDKHFANGKFIVLDDDHELSGNDGYYTGNFEITRDNVKYAGKTKFEPKVLVWLAISSKGISAPVIRPRGAKAINADIYIDQFLPKLEQFIERKHTQDKNVLAGSDKQSLCEKNIELAH